MNAKQLERASYMAAHAILASNTSAPHLATPGARRTYTIDAIADTIRSVFELHCSALDESTDWWSDQESLAGTVDVPQQARENSLKRQLVMQDLH